MADGLGTPPAAATPTVGVVSDEDYRLDQGAFLALTTSILDIRTGVLHGPSTTALVTGTSATGTMTVAIGAHHWVTSRSTADGVYVGTLEAPTTTTIAAAPGSNSRIDVVWVKQNDSSSSVSPDGTTAPEYGKTTGTAAVSPTKPTIPVGAVELATVTVATGATSTNGAGVTITNTVRQTVARGADLPVRTSTERDALTKFVGLAVKRLDDGGRVERWTGSVWAGQSDVPVLANVGARDTYFTGNLRAGAQALVGGNVHTYDGSAWHWSRRGYSDLVGDAGGNIIVPHGLGAAPTGVLVTPGPQLSTLLQNIADFTWTTADATNFVVQVRRDDTNAVLGTQQVRFSWQAFV